MMHRLEDDYRLIASVLSPSEKELDPFHLSADWERFVYLSSSHLVLPAAYCQVQQKGWRPYFPADLLDYLEAVTAENRRRNEAIWLQMKELSALFAAAGIQCVFLKGAGMLAGGHYKDIGERMLGDIDLLVHAQDGIAAYQLLEQSGYHRLAAEGFQKPLSATTKDKHLPRLVHPDKIAAVEIHNRLNQNGHKERLKPQAVLSRSAAAEQGLCPPHPSDLLLHIIYNWHLNDTGGARLAISFRSAYDVLLLLEKYPSLRAVLQEQPVARRFCALISPFFPVLPQQRTWRQSLFRLKLRSPLLGKAWDVLVYEILRLPVRLPLFFRFPDYRRRVFQVIAQRGKGLFRIAGAGPDRAAPGQARKSK